MIQEILDKINVRVNGFSFLQLYLYAFTREELTVAASEDFSYFHNFEIRFKNVYTIITNVEWNVNTTRPIIQLLEEGSEEADKLNLQYRGIIGSRIFKFVTEDDDWYYVIAEDIEYVDKVVKYYE